jgi:hypothetical protein
MITFEDGKRATGGWRLAAGNWLGSCSRVYFAELKSKFVSKTKDHKEW